MNYEGAVGEHDELRAPPELCPENSYSDSEGEDQKRRMKLAFPKSERKLNKSVQGINGLYAGE